MQISILDLKSNDGGNVMSKLGETVKRIRKSKNMSQETFAESLGYKSATTINKIELGINDMGYDAIVRLISQYDVDVNDLFESNIELDSKIKSNGKNEIVLFENQGVRLEVNVKDDTVWLNQDQISRLYGRDRTVILQHIKNALDEELRGVTSTCAKFAQVQIEGDRKVKREIEYYNLDVIISVGYRVKSSQGIAFRRWANNVLKSYMLKGYAINKQRLEYLEKTVKLIDIASRNVEELTNDNAKDVLLVIDYFSKGLDLLDDYDHQCLPKISGKKDDRIVTYEDCMQVINKLKFNQRGDLFARERNSDFKSIIGNIYQSFDGEDVYPSVELKAANLLYFIVKDHAFIDGNKRIAASIFLYFMNFYGLLYRDGKTCISNNTLAALTLLIAESKADEKELIIDVVMNIVFG